MDNLFLEILYEAAEYNKAVGAINVFNHITAEGAMSAANEIMENIIIQTSAGTVKRFGAKPLFRMIDSIRAGIGVKAALHLDHCREDEVAIECIKAGWDSIMMDCSHLPLRENIRRTRNMAEIAHSKDVAIEGEIGVIAGVEEDIVSHAAAGAGYGETMEFIEMSEIDAVAPAIGTAHGVYKGVPKLDYDLVEKLGKQPVPLVIHGGTGLSAEAFIRLIDLGGRKVNISTLVKKTYMDTIRGLACENREYSPIAFDDHVRQAVIGAVQGHLKVFAGISRVF